LGVPVPKRKRIGIRASHLHEAISKCYGASPSAKHANFKALFESAFAGIARAGELASGKPPARRVRGQTPMRSDVSFKMLDGRPVGCTLYIVNSKARGAEALRKIPVRLPMKGKFISPGQTIWDLIHIHDPTPASLADSTPLFRDPRTGAVLTVSKVRDELRVLMCAIGRIGAWYGAHSLRIGGATAMAFLGAPTHIIKTSGRWRSDAYLAYVRSSRMEHYFYSDGVCSAEVDDFEADHLDFEAADLDEDDWT
jgi:hypothetical protein